MVSGRGLWHYDRVRLARSVRNRRTVGLLTRKSPDLWVQVPGIVWAFRVAFIGKWLDEVVDVDLVGNHV